MPWVPSFLWIMRESRSPWVRWHSSKKYTKVVLSSFDKEVYKDAEVIEGEEVMTPRPKEQGRQTLFVHTSKIPRDTRDRRSWRRTGSGLPGFAPARQRRGVAGDAREVEISHQKDWSNKDWAEGLVVWAEWLGGRHRKNLSSQSELNRRSALRESPLSMRRVAHTYQALTMCEDRQVGVNASDASYVSLDRVDDLFPI